MTLQQIQYVLTIARAGSMNKAAEALFLSQPSLTNAVKELEKEIGITIFLRSSKGVVQTNEGAEFLIYARQLYQQYELLRQKYGEKGNIKRKFGVSTQHYSFAVNAFVETVKRFDTLRFEFALRETKTAEVISDVGQLKSELGIIYLSVFNNRIIRKMLNDNGLEFHHLIDCNAYVYLYKGHPLAGESSVSMSMLSDFPCLSFEQGENSSFFLAEEILSDKDYARTVKVNDRATMLNLMKGLGGYTLCSGIICEELNGDDYVAVPFEEDSENQNSVMEIGYISKKYSTPSDIAEVYISELKKYLRLS